MTNKNNTFCMPFSDIKYEVLQRAKTGIDTLDWMYGYTTGNDGITCWGLPRGKISLWYGEKGIGKSRVAIAVARALTNSGYKVLYFQSEAPISDFAQWASHFDHPENLIVSNADNLPDIIAHMKEANPEFVFIDSVNEIEEFCNGSKREARFLMKGDEDQSGLKDVVNELQCHVILLGQLNQDGSAKGGTSLPHLVDIEMEICRPTPNDKKIFTVRVGSKHRHGRTGPEFFSLWMHREDGVAPITDYQLNDPIWCKTHGVRVRYQVQDNKQVVDMGVRKKMTLGEAARKVLGI